MKRILIAGIGNIFLGDDAFGVEVAQRLMQRPLPPAVRVIDFGIRSYDLAYALTDGYDVVILIDAVSRGEAPGTVCLIKPDMDELPAPENGVGPELPDAHSLNPMRVLQLARSLGGELPEALVLVGCEPAVLATEQIGLSPLVHAAIPPAIETIESLVAELLDAPLTPAPVKAEVTAT